MNRTNVVNDSTPLNRFTGIEDSPAPSISPRPPQYPLHNALVPLFTRKGTTKKIVPSASEKLVIYGESSFDNRSKYYNGYTRLSNLLTGVANMHSTIRIKPTDAPAPANITIYMDVLETIIPLYKRNSDGSYALDNLGNKIEDGTTMGIRRKLFGKLSKDGMKPGSQKILPGTMVDEVDGTIKSNMIPIMDVPAKEFGEYYSNLGFRISPVIGKKLQPRFATDGKFLPYEISIISRKDKNSTGTEVKNLRDGVSSLVSFKKDAIHPYTEGILDVDLIFPHNWYDEGENAKFIRYYDIDNIHFYYENLDNLLSRMLANEVNHISIDSVEYEDGQEASTIDWFDFTSPEAEGEQHLVNWVTLKSSSKEVNYHTVIEDSSVVTAPEDMMEITLGSDSVVYLMGGGDGTVSDEELTKFIDSMTSEYLDPDAKVTNLISNHEVSFYDYGLDLPTKKMLGRVLAVRPDTIVHWATHLDAYGDEPMDSDEEMDLAIALLATAELYPESEIFGTSVCRATIMMGSYKDINSKSKKRLSQNYEIANIFGQYLGSADGKMNENKCLDDGRANTIFTLGENYTPEYMSDTFKTSAFSLGLMYSEDYTNNRKALLAPRTVHNNEMSVLTDPTLLYLNAKVCRDMDLAHKEFAGNRKDSNDVFANMIVKFLNKRLVGVIDNNRYEVSYDVIFDAPEVDGRPYAYKIVCNIGGRLMKTAQVTTVRTYVIE